MEDSASIDVSVERDTAVLQAIIMGTGRCGSTLLSCIFRLHPEILSLSEFFAMLPTPLFSEERIDAAAFWQILSTPNMSSLGASHPDVSIPEILYPHAEDTRFNHETGFPPILLVALPHLTENYEALYDELATAVNQFPHASIPEHLAHLFLWLKERFGRRIAIERSGFSLQLLPDLIQIFPQVKYVHLVREGRDCIWSMYKHNGFRIVAFFQGGIPVVVEDEDGSSYLKRIIDAHIPLEAFGRIWLCSLIRGVHMLLQLPEEQVMTIRYEDILAAPRSSVIQLANFIDPSLYNEAWVDAACSIIREPSTKWQPFPEAEREIVEKMCAQGKTLIDVLINEGPSSKNLTTLLVALSQEYEIAF